VFRWLLNSFIVSLGTTIGVLAPVQPRRLRLRAARIPVPPDLVHLRPAGPRHPEQAVILPQHQLFADLGLHNSYPG
jgi:multiple sugar transport system permease protein